MRFNVLDFALLIAIFGSMIAAAIKGFTYEVLMMAATLAGIALAAWKYAALAARWHGGTGAGHAANFVAFWTIVAAVLVAAMVVARLMRGIVRAAGLGLVDRVLGAGLGLVRGVLVGAALLMMLIAYPFNPRLVRESRLAPSILWISRGLAALMPIGLRARFVSGLLESAPAAGARSNRRTD